ncbi:MAG TPA: glycosyltransferase family 2 protein [Thermoleophilaceae bacterium]
MSPEPGAPLVTVGVPTFNRAAMLQRAVESALAQEGVSLEVVISDNASTDGTAELCRRLAEADGRVRVLTQDHNIGAHANLRAVLDAASAPHFAWLADDDWLGPGALRACLDVLSRRPDHSLVAPAVEYFGVAGELALEEPPVNAASRRPGARVAQYFATLTRNGVFYGVAHTDRLRAAPFPPTIAGDWHLVAALAAAGPIRTLPDVQLNRTLGPSEDPVATAVAHGASGLRSRQQHLWIAAALLSDIAWRAPAFRRLGPAPRRAFVGGAAAAVVFGRFSLQVWLIQGLRAARLLPLARVLKSAFANRGAGAGSRSASES